MREIPLTHGLVALVDDDDFEWLSRHKWHAHRGGKGDGYGFYAYRTVHLGVGMARPKSLRIAMHGVLMGGDRPGFEVDHINLNGLDNRRANLRWATRSQQRANQGPRIDGSSGFKGVSFHRKARKWTAQVQSGGKYYYLGLHATPEDAARAYDRAALELFGEFARINFPDLTKVGNHATPS